MKGKTLSVRKDGRFGKIGCAHSWCRRIPTTNTASYFDRKGERVSRKKHEILLNTEVFQRVNLSLFDVPPMRKMCLQGTTGEELARL